MVNVEYETNGKMIIPSTPLSADNTLTKVDLTEDFFTQEGIEWNSTDGRGGTANKQVGTGIKLENGRTYLYTFYTTYHLLSERMYAINDSSTEISGTTCWGSTDNRRGISDSEEVVINGITYYKWTHAIAVPTTGDYYLWATYNKTLGLDYVELKYF